MGYAAMSDEMTKTVMLHLLYVRPPLQRQGIGRDIFAELETCFPDAEIMRLEVEPRNNDGDRLLPCGTASTMSAAMKTTGPGNPAFRR